MDYWDVAPKAEMLSWAVIMGCPHEEKKILLAAINEIENLFSKADLAEGNEKEGLYREALEVYKTAVSQLND